MKLVTAIVRTELVDRVKEALKQTDAGGATFTPTHGFGVQRGTEELYRGAEHVDDMHAKTEVRVLVADEQLPAVLGAIVYSARTGEIGDGKVWVTPVEEAIRIRTGEEGAVAILRPTA